MVANNKIDLAIDRLPMAPMPCLPYFHDHRQRVPVFLALISGVKIFNHALTAPAAPGIESLTQPGRGALFSTQRTAILSLILIGA